MLLCIDILFLQLLYTPLLLTISSPVVCFSESRKRFYSETTSPTTPPLTSTNYKPDAAAVHVRAFFTQVAAWFSKNKDVQPMKNGYEVTMGAVLSRSFEDGIHEVFTDEEWEHLTRLNEWANIQNHKTYLPREADGSITMVNPSDVFDAKAMKSIAFKTNIVASVDQLIVKKSTDASPPRNFKV